MKKYEIVKEVYRPCAPDTCEITEQEVENPEAYVREMFKSDKSAEFSITEKDGAVIIEVVCEAAQRHRYTFSEI